MKISKPISVFFLVACSQLCAAIPLTLNYDVTAVSGGYHYQFNLELDNNDNTWVLGQQWDWIVFADRMGSSTSAPAISCADWVWGVSDANVQGRCSGGFHQGNTIAYGASGLGFPGWSPLSVGEVLSWSGVSRTLVKSNNMYWSPLLTSNGVGESHFIQAKQGRVVLSEPTTFLLLGLGLLYIGMARCSATKR